MSISQRATTCFFPALILTLIAATTSTMALDNGVARTPPMGWSSFNQWGGSWTTPVLKAAADSLIKLGLADCGYTYVNCDGNDGNEGMSYDDFWPGSARFVEWASPVAEYMHDKGLKFGVYMTSTTNPQATAEDIATAKIDYLKHDDWGGKPLDFWKAMSDALLATGRPVVYSTNSCSDPTVVNMYRTGRDINPEWATIMTDYGQNYFHLTQAKPGFWPDPDMLEVGCTYGFDNYMHTFNEDKSHFAMWCMMAAPLLIGFDLTRSSAFGRLYTDETYVHTIAVLSNIELIAINQDSLGKAGERIKGQDAFEVWTKELKDGTKAVAFFNRTDAAGNMNVSQAELGWPAAEQIYMRDLWTHENLEPFSGTFTINVATHMTHVYRMSTEPIPATDILKRMDRSIAWLKQHGHDVFPHSGNLTVFQGTSADAAIFDVQGRLVGSRMNCANGAMLILRAPAGAGKHARMLSQIFGD